MEGIEIGLRIRPQDLENVRREMQELPSVIGRGWEGLAKSIAQDPGASGFMGSAFRERLNLSSRRIEEISQAGASQGFFTGTQRRDFDRELSNYERLSERYWRMRHQQAKQGVDRIAAEVDRLEKKLESTSDMNERLSVAKEYLAKQQELERAKTEGGKVEAQKIAEERQAFRARIEEMRDTAALVPNADMPQPGQPGRPDHPSQILGQFMRGIVGVGAIGGIGYYLASTLRGKFHEELARGMTAADLAQRIQPEGMGYDRFRSTVNYLNPSMGPEGSLRFLSIYSSLAGGTDLLSTRSQRLVGGNIVTSPGSRGRADEAAELTRLFGFSPEQGASLFGQSWRQGMTNPEQGQRRFAAMLAEAVKQGGIQGREAEVWEAVLRLGEAAVGQGVRPNAEALLGYVAQLSSSGNPALQGEHGANIMQRMSAAMSGINIMPNVDMITPIALSMLRPGQRLGELQAKLEQGIHNPEFFRAFIQEGQRQFGSSPDAMASFARQLNIPLNVQSDVLRLIQQKPDFTAEDLRKIVGDRRDQPEEQVRQAQGQLASEIGEQTRKLMPVYQEFLESMVGATQALKNLNAATAQKLQEWGISPGVAQGAANIGTGAALAAGAYGAYRLVWNATLGKWMYGNGAGAAVGVGDVGWQAAKAGAGMGWGSWLGTVGLGAGLGVLEDLLFPASAGGPESELSPGSAGYGIGKGFSSGELNPLIKRASQRHGVPESMIRALIAKESGGRNLISSAGAVGVMQLMPRTAGKTPEQLLDPAENIEIGTRYYSELLRMFSGDQEKALAGYNAGPGRVMQAVKSSQLKGGNWKEYLPKDEPGGVNDVSGFVASVLAKAAEQQNSQSVAMNMGTVKVAPIEVVIKDKDGRITDQFRTQAEVLPQSQITSPLLP